MKTPKNPKGLKLKACLNCVKTELPGHGSGGISPKWSCPCPNFSGEIYRENGRIVKFLCKNRKMHQAPETKKGSPNTSEKRIEARLRAIESGEL